MFPPNAEVPVTLQYKIRLHEQLAELVADRYGYMEVDNLDVCVTAFFKMASGLDLVKMNVSIEALLADNDRRLEYFLKDKGMSRVSTLSIQSVYKPSTCLPSRNRKRIWIRAWKN